MTPDAPPPVPPRVRLAILALVAVTTVAGTLGTAFLPYLLVRYPGLLLLSSAEGRNIVLVAPELDLATVLLIATPRRALAMLATCGLGALYGRVMLAWSARRLPRLTRFLDGLERLFLRFQSSILLVWPAYTPSMLAGITRMPMRRYLPWMLAGQVAYVIVFYFLGAALARWTDRLVAAITPHVWEATAVCAALVAVQQVFALVRRRRARAAARAREAAEPPRSPHTGMSHTPP